MKRLRELFYYLVLSVAALSFIYPFYWMFMASITPEARIGESGLLPPEVTIQNYSIMAAKIPILRALINSLFVALSATAGVLVFGAMTGYALAKLRFPGREALFFVVIFTMTLPFQVTLIPNYVLMVKLQWVDSFASLIIPAMNSAFAILLFRQAFKRLPDDLIHAARMDGCGELRIIFQILLPNIKPTVITAGILTFMNSWNDVLWPLIVIRDEMRMTMPQLVTLFAVGGRADAQLGVKLAAAVLLALPVIIAYIIFQRHFIQSMSSSGMKG